ncbi:MAG: hypothetical protein JO273_07135 [Methylobacteriaceae bacterium]|nr:hypothetical protein [Methylobacteriaceae bacterium]
MIARFIAIALAGFCALAAPPASANQGFELVNPSSTASIVGLSYARHGSYEDGWDIVDLTPIGPRATGSFTLDETACYQDLKVRFDDGYERIFLNVDICDGGAVVAN